MDVLAIEGRNEGVLEPMANVVADLVAPMFGISKLAGTALDRVVVLEHRFEQPRGAEDVGGILDEQIEESLFAGNESHDRLAPLAGRAKSTSSRIGGGRRFAPIIAATRSVRQDPARQDPHGGRFVVHDGTLRLAHQGDWREAAPNSLRAFAAAARVPGCDGVELDARRSRDGPSSFTMNRWIGSRASMPGSTS